VSRRPNYPKRLARDLFFIAASIVIAILFVRIGVIQKFISFTNEIGIVSSFLTGIFFTSIFTIAPAAIALAKISETVDPITVAFWGATGAMLGDLLIFLFIRDAFIEDLRGTIGIRRSRKILSFFHLGLFRWIAPLLGALIIASPLPDEMGLALLGASNVSTLFLIPIAFVMNFLGIILIAIAAGTF
jgi:hypothetical protein